MKKSLSFLTLIASLISFAPIAYANPSSYIETKTAVATTTPAFMTPGTATTTLSVDTQKDNAPFDSLSLAIQFSASSTQSVLRWRYEYANNTGSTDCTVATSTCDWYSTSVNNVASTATTTQEVGTFQEYSWQFASSTPGATTNPQDRGLKMIPVTAFTRFVRVIFYLPAASFNGAVWADFVGKRQNR